MLPIILQSPVIADRQTRRAVADYATRLLARPAFKQDAPLMDLAVSKLQEAPALVLADFTEVSLFPKSSLYQEQRARLRALPGDMVVTVTARDAAFDDYIGNELGLGKVQWMSAPADSDSLRIAQTCWTDRALRREIVHAMRSRCLRYIHPLMGNRDVWRMAQLMSRAAHLPLRVIAPPPAVARWANNKISFTTLVSDLLGSQFVPQTKSAFGFAFLSQRVHELAQTSRYLGIKVPASAGGAGNIFLDAAPLRSMNLRELNEHLKSLIPAAAWPADVPLLVDVWETNVLENASIQTWIPPLADGDPVLEGVFSQMISGISGNFVGCIPLHLPDEIQKEVVVATSWLTLLFQQMGYVGRCSFDFLLVGDSLENAQLKFIECNGRWGGTSIPMTLINRLFGDWKAQPFAAISLNDTIPATMSFSELLSALQPDLLRMAGRETPSGWLLPFNPGRLVTYRGLSWIVIGKDVDQVQKRVNDDLPARLKSLGPGANPMESGKCADSHTGDVDIGIPHGN